MVLICISLMVNDIKHVFMCLLAIFISCSVKCVFRYFAKFLIGFCFLLLSFERFLYILEASPLVNMCFASIFLPVCSLPFHLLNMTFHRANIDFHEVQFNSFCLLKLYWGVIDIEKCTYLMYTLDEFGYTHIPMIPSPQSKW